MTDYIWLPCDFEGCKRQEDGECDHCGFHAGEMSLLEMMGQKKVADKIRDEYTLPVSDEAIHARATRCSPAPVASAPLDIDIAEEVMMDWKMSGAASAALRIVG